MKYYRVTEESRNEIPYSKALDIMLGSWKDNDMTRDMLSIPNKIRCQFSVIEVEDDNGRIGDDWNNIPNDVAYNIDGNRMEG